MKKSQLREILRELVHETLELESQASDAAKSQGLEYLGFGRYGKDGKMTHRTVNGKLQPVKSAGTAPTKKAVKPTATASTKQSAKKKTSGALTIPKKAHSDPNVNQKVAAAMSNFRINQDGFGGGFEWNKSSKSYEYDDNEGGFDYYVGVKPLDNDEYEIDFGKKSGKKPVRVKGLVGVKKHLEDSEGSSYPPEPPIKIGPSNPSAIGPSKFSGLFGKASDDELERGQRDADELDALIKRYKKLRQQSNDKDFGGGGGFSGGGAGGRF